MARLLKIFAELFKTLGKIVVAFFWSEAKLASVKSGMPISVSIFLPTIFALAIISAWLFKSAKILLVTSSIEK